MLDRWFAFLLRWHHCHTEHNECHDKHLFVWIRFKETAILLRPNQREFIMRQIHEDTLDTITIAAVDSQGNPVSPVVFDAPPAWTNTDDAVAKLTVAPNALSAVLDPQTVDGVTTVSVSVVIGGTTFAARADYTVISGAVASISLVDTFSPRP
jgi:hypothetical protein